MAFLVSWGLGGAENMVLACRMFSSSAASEANRELGDSGTGAKDCTGPRNGEGAKVGCWVGSQA